MNFLAYGEFSQIFELADSLSTLYFDTKNYCGFKELDNALSQHCQLMSETKQSVCSPKSIFKNLSQKHLIDVMGSFGALGDIINSEESFKEMDSEDIYEETLSFGRLIGNIVGRSIDY